MQLVYSTPLANLTIFEKFGKQTDHPIPVRWFNLVLITKKRTCQQKDFYCFRGSSSKNEINQKERQILGTCWRAKKKLWN